MDSDILFIFFRKRDFQKNLFKSVFNQEKSANPSVYRTVSFCSVYEFVSFVTLRSTCADS